jgi:hypothetical protein
MNPSPVRSANLPIPGEVIAADRWLEIIRSPERRNDPLLGRVVESGTVPQLLAAGGLFSRFYALQLRDKHSGQEFRPHAVPAQ